MRRALKVDQHAFDPPWNLSGLPDESLYEMFRAGSSMALKALIDRHTGMLRRMARNIVGDEHEADDVVQDVFVAIWKRKDAWTPSEAKFSTWIYRVGINKAIDHRRRRKASPEAPDVVARAIDARQDIGQDQGAQLAGLQDQQLSARLRLAVARLPEAQKTALQLFYFEDQDVDQIATTMDASEQAVRSLLKRGRQALREQMRKEKKISPHDHHGTRTEY